ncbi:unnamed protein product [Debaryomyces fabryi]|nr:unnamed protein product [Debaryomyces fabryi]CUM56013.1 unnamed protein product [Debaryomyces fabryi]
MATLDFTTKPFAL